MAHAQDSAGNGNTAAAPFSRIFESTVATPTTITLYVTDGYDEKNQKTLVDSGDVEILQFSDDDWWQQEGGYFTSLEFDQLVPAGVLVTSVEVFVEHWEEAGFTAGQLELQVGSGSVLPLILGPKESDEDNFVWDVTSLVSDVNDLRVNLVNRNTEGKKASFDRVYVVVVYLE